MNCRLCPVPFISPLVRRERGSLLWRRPPAHQFLLPERAPRKSPCAPAIYVIRLDGTAPPARFWALIHRIFLSGFTPRQSGRPQLEMSLSYDSAKAAEAPASEAAEAATATTTAVSPR
jgi:hypothetical protein